MLTALHALAPAVRQDGSSLPRVVLVTTVAETRAARGGWLGLRGPRSPLGRSPAHRRAGHKPCPPQMAGVHFGQSEDHGVDDPHKQLRATLNKRFASPWLPSSALVPWAADDLGAAAAVFPTLAQEVKPQLLLSLLTIKQPVAESLREPLRKVLRAAAEEEHEWVRAMLGLLSSMAPAIVEPDAAASAVTYASTTLDACVRDVYARSKCFVCVRLCCGRLSSRVWALGLAHGALTTFGSSRPSAPRVP